MLGDVVARWDGPRGLAALCIGLLSAVAIVGPPVVAAAYAPSPARTLLEDPPEPLVPRSPRTEREEDRLCALAHFSTARAFQQRKEYAEALRHYQRALRYDAPAAETVWPIVALAEQLGWRDVRDRYLLRAAKLDPEAFDPAELIELAEIVSSDDELQMVAGLFETAIARRGAEKKTSLDVVLRWRLAEIHVAAERYGKAADAAAGALEALEHPESFGIARDQLTKWFGDAERLGMLFGEYFFLAGRLDKAEATFEKAHHASPNAGRLHFELARIDLKRHKPADALSHLEACLAEGFSDEGAALCELMGQALAARGKSDELLGRVEKLVAARPDDVALACFAARQHAAAGRLDEALARYETLLEKRPTAAVYSGLVKLLRRRGDVERLLAVLSKASAANPALEQLGDERRAIAGDAALVDKLLAAARTRLAKDPRSLGARAPLALALLASDADRSEAAGPFFEWAVAADPDNTSDALLLWGGNLMAQDQYAKAADVFRRGAEGKVSDEDRPIFRYYLASALELAGRTDDALAAAREACRLNNESPLLAGHEAWILYHAGRNDLSREAYERFLERFDANHASPGTRQAVREARLVLSHLEVQRGNHKVSVERLEEVLDEFPNDVSAMNDLGFLWADEGAHLERAFAMVRRAVDAEPDNAAYRDSLGWALYRLGRMDEAIVALEKAAGDLPDGEILDHLGEVYLKSGKKTQAADAWRRAVEAYRKADEPDKARNAENRLKNVAGEAGE